MMDTDIYSPDIICMLNNTCICGEPLPYLFEILVSKDKDIFICKRCGKDNTPSDCVED